jgi:hypothetical protein
VVQHPHVDELQGLAQAAGDREVRAAGLGHAGGVLGCIEQCQQDCGSALFVEL